MNLRRTQRFDNAYLRLPQRIQNKADRQLALLMQNPRHPSLRLHKMQGFENQWEISVTLSYRIVLQIIDDTYLLLNIGPHDILNQ